MALAKRPVILQDGVSGCGDTGEAEPRVDSGSMSAPHGHTPETNSPYHVTRHKIYSRCLNAGQGGGWPAMQCWMVASLWTIALWLF